MEALYFLKFWRPTSATTSNKDSQSSTEIAAAHSVADTENEFDVEEEEDDSFFELELTVPADFDKNRSSNTTTTTTTDNNNNNKSNCPLDTDSNRFDSKLENLIYTSSAPNNNHNKAAGKFPQHNKCQQQPIDLLSKRKILPIDQPPTPLRPQSPISLLKSSAPRFRVLMFKRSKSTGQKTEEKTEYNNEARNQESSKLFTVKFWLQDSSATNSKFTRGNSLRRQIFSDVSPSLADDSSKRFSREAIQKYLKLINPLYIRVPSRKQQGEKVKFSGQLSLASPSCSPANFQKKEKQVNIPAGIRVVCRHLGKSKSASSATFTAGSFPATVSRRDDSLTLQHDGIQSAILHCKRSFNSSSSRDSSVLSRFARDPSHGKSMESPRISNFENYGIS